jgi:aspartate/methionine/tyrosine aminotransferase
MELVGFDEKVKGHIYKLASSSLCSTVSGQVMTSLMVKGPKPGDESYESHESEKKAIFDSLKRRAKLVSEGLDAIPGFSCQPAQGAMYCFPKIKMPLGAIKAAEEEGTTPDALFALSLLEATGIVVVPAAGFGQKDGRYGFRTTFLPSEEEMERCVKDIRSHYEAFCKQYA